MKPFYWVGFSGMEGGAERIVRKLSPCRHCRNRPQLKTEWIGEKQKAEINCQESCEGAIEINDSMLESMSAFAVAYKSWELNQKKGLGI